MNSGGQIRFSTVFPYHNQMTSATGCKRGGTWGPGLIKRRMGEIKKPARMIFHHTAGFSYIISASPL